MKPMDLNNLKCKKIGLTCTNCGRKFICWLSVYLNNINRRNQERFYCSKKCAYFRTEPKERTCNICGKVKLLSEFRKDKKGKTYNRCKECERVKNNKYRRTLHGRFKIAIKKARHRNLIWELDFEQFKEILINKCEYCNKDIITETGYSLDRKDNNLGYTIENVVACCEICNKVKLDYFTYDEMCKIGKVINEIELERLNKPNE